jgi:hypothetical protein
MRDKLNSNPLLQAALVGVLLVFVAIFVSSSGGGGEESSESESTAAASVATAEAAPSATSPTNLGTALSAVGQAGATQPLPRPVLRAYRANRTLVLLFVRDRGIDDDLTKLATRGLSGFRDVSLFVVPAHQISRYAAISEGVGVDRVPALVVVTPKHIRQSVPTASVSYGFQSVASVRQAVIDAGYRGPTVDYHP